MNGWGRPSAVSAVPSVRIAGLHGAAAWLLVAIAVGMLVTVVVF
jgi:hypothetical protein